MQYIHNFSIHNLFIQLYIWDFQKLELTNSFCGQQIQKWDIQEPTPKN